jgi:hypothetical protein
MGRGKSKAKQTKVARRLKYEAVNNDLIALKSELTNLPLGDEDISKFNLSDNEYPPDEAE